MNRSSGLLTFGAMAILSVSMIVMPVGLVYAEVPAASRFDEALAAKDAAGIIKLFSGELSPSEYDARHNAYFWKRVVMTGDVDFVMPVLRSIEQRDGFPIYYVGDNYENPLFACIDTKNIQLVKAVVTWRPKLLRETSYFNRTGESVKPFTHAVELGSIELVRALLELGATVENQELAYTEGSFELGQDHDPTQTYLPTYAVPANSYSFAKSQEMRAFLESRGARTILPPDGREGSTVPAAALDDRVRIRSAPDLSGKTLGYLSKDEQIEVTALTAADFELGGKRFRWYRLRTRAGIDGWAYGQFIHVGAWTGP